MSIHLSSLRPISVRLEQEKARYCEESRIYDHGVVVQPCAVTSRVSLAFWGLSLSYRELGFILGLGGHAVATVKTGVAGGGPDCRMFNGTPFGTGCNARLHLKLNSFAAVDLMNLQIPK